MNSYLGMKCDELEIEVAKLKSENRELRDEDRELRNEDTDLVCWMNAQLVASNSFFKD
ncbi:hypothetical protein HpBHB38_14450 [Helicobacter pylori]